MDKPGIIIKPNGASGSIIINVNTIAETAPEAPKLKQLGLSLCLIIDGNVANTIPPRYSERQKIKPIELVAKKKASILIPNMYKTYILNAKCR